MFGEDSFTETGNHNLLVNLKNKLAIERGAESVFLNATALILSKKIYVKIGFDFFTKEFFWKAFQILCYSQWFFLFYKLSTSYVAMSKGIDLIEKALSNTSLAATINNQCSWVLEMIDLSKDWIYLFMFYHRLLPFLILAFSLSFPFALIDAAINDDY